MKWDVQYVFVYTSHLQFNDTDFLASVLWRTVETHELGRALGRLVTSWNPVTSLLGHSEEGEMVEEEVFD